MYTIQLEGQDYLDLASAANFAGTDKAKLLLTAVKLHLVGETLSAVATDSYKLVTIKRDITELAGDYATMGELLVPGVTMLKAAKSVKAVRRALPNVLMTFNEDNTFTISAAGDITGGELIYGKYPEVAQVIPGANGISKTDAIAFDPNQLAQFAKVAPFNAKSVGSSTMVIRTITDKTRPMRVESTDGRTVAVLMPVRMN